LSHASDAAIDVAGPGLPTRSQARGTHSCGRPRGESLILAGIPALRLPWTPRAKS